MTDKLRMLSTNLMQRARSSRPNSASMDSDNSDTSEDEDDNRNNNCNISYSNNSSNIHKKNNQTAMANICNVNYVINNLHNAQSTVALKGNKEINHH